ncbi:MAG: hypothetical protein NC429_00795 [Lachnospiraceae bacterium]|nr:hypothetical protein [Lachnospiraceae bacterium]
MGYEKLFISPPDAGESDYEVLYARAEKVIQSIAFEQYEDIVFTAKSIGTVIACRLKEAYKIPASLILFTPLNDTLPYINRQNNVLLACMGEDDRHLDFKKLRELCEQENIKCCIEPNVGHRMEVKGDIKRFVLCGGNVMFDKALIMAKGMNNRFPAGNSPYEIMTRLLEECGEAASIISRAYC